MLLCNCAHHCCCQLASVAACVCVAALYREERERLQTECFCKWQDTLCTACYFGVKPSKIVMPIFIILAGGAGADTPYAKDGVMADFKCPGGKGSYTLDPKTRYMKIKFRRSDTSLVRSQTC
eukprot:COSAG01_NODE_3454_length_6075_cov_5.552878_6_plen_122_part_00